MVSSLFKRISVYHKFLWPEAVEVLSEREAHVCLQYLALNGGLFGTLVENVVCASLLTSSIKITDVWCAGEVEKLLRLFAPSV